MRDKSGVAQERVEAKAGGLGRLSRPQKFRAEFLGAIAELNRNPSVRLSMRAYRYGVTRKRVRELARQMARAAAKTAA